MTMELTSSVFSNGGEIPAEHTCDGANRPVPLAWSGTPTGTAELALVMDDPDARGFVHWVVVGIPPDTTSLGADGLPIAAREGRTDFSSKTGYGGPCPPSGSHRYQFTLYALSETLSVSDVPTGDDVRSAAVGRTLAEARLTGRYARSR